MGVVLIDKNPKLHKLLCTHLGSAEGEIIFTNHTALLVISLLRPAGRENALKCYFAHVAVELIFVLSGNKKKLTNRAKMRDMMTSNGG